MIGVTDVGKPGIKEGWVAGRVEVFRDVSGGEGMSLGVFDRVRVGGGDHNVEGCGVDSCEDLVSEGCLIWVVLRAVVWEGDEARVCEGWVCMRQRGGRREAKGSGVVVPALSGGDCQGVGPVISGSGVVRCGGSIVGCRVCRNHGFAH